MPVIKQRDASGKKEGLANVVRDENDGFLETACKGDEFALKLGAGDGVEGAEGFVHKKDRRISSERTSDTDALTLAAR